MKHDKIKTTATTLDRETKRNEKNRDAASMRRNRQVFGLPGFV